MTQRPVSPGQVDRLVLGMNEKEKTFLSIILMNHGQIPETKFKRIYMEKNKFWDLQSIRSKLAELGLLAVEVNESGDSTYSIPKRYHVVLYPALSFRTDYKSKAMEFFPEIQTCCEEYSILWHLFQIDSETGLRVISTKKGKGPRISLQRVQDLLGTDEWDSRFILDLTTILSKGKFFKKNGIKKWSDVQKNPNTLIKQIYKIIYYDLRENGILGREDVGKDNIDFLIDELEGLEVGRWYPLKIFINNLKDTLFSANQPFRWIHFEKEVIWKILNRELRLLGLLQTAKSSEGLRYFSSTPLGAFCLNGISEEEFQRLLDVRKGSLLVHPNFEVTLVSKELHPGILLTLGMFAYPVKLDTMSVFRLSRESVQKGMNFGLRPENMLALLKENTKGEVPQNVEYSILDWSK